MFCCSIGKTRQIQQPKMTGQEGHDRACARTRTRTTASREVAVSGTASTAAAVEEQQPQEESSLLPLNNTLINVMESTTRHDETDGCAACCQEEKINCWQCDFPRRPQNQ